MELPVFEAYKISVAGGGGVPPPELLPPLPPHAQKENAIAERTENRRRPVEFNGTLLR
jgi:hypothetical protein